MIVSSRLLLILAVLFWSGNYVMGRAVVTTIPPITLAYLRWFLAFLIFLPFCWKELKENWETVKNNWPYFVVLGMTGIMGFNFLQYLSVKYTTAINATIINSATPMFTAIAAYLILKESLRSRQVMGIILSILGVLSIITNNNLTKILSMSFNAGDIIMLMAVLVNTVYYLTLRIKGRIAPPKTLFIASVMGGLIAAIPIVLADIYLSGTAWTAKINFNHYLSLLYFAIFPSILAILFFNRAILDIGPVKTSIYVNLGIVFTSVLGIVFLDEALRWAHFVGAILIVSGVWFTNTVPVAKDKEGDADSKRQDTAIS